MFNDIWKILDISKKIRNTSDVNAKYILFNDIIYLINSLLKQHSFNQVYSAFRQIKSYEDIEDIDLKYIDYVFINIFINKNVLYLFDNKDADKYANNQVILFNTKLCYKCEYFNFSQDSEIYLKFLFRIDMLSFKQSFSTINHLLTFYLKKYLDYFNNSLETKIFSLVQYLLHNELYEYNKIIVKVNIFSYDSFIDPMGWYENCSIQNKINIFATIDENSTFIKEKNNCFFLKIKQYFAENIFKQRFEI